jgi:hypothetical protein
MRSLFNKLGTKVKFDKFLLLLIAFFNYYASVSLVTWTEIEQAEFVILNLISVIIYMIYYILYKYDKEISDIDDFWLKPMLGYASITCKSFLFAVVIRLFGNTNVNSSFIKNFYIVLIGSLEVWAIAALSGVAIVLIFFIKMILQKLRHSKVCHFSGNELDQ